VDAETKAETKTEETKNVKKKVDDTAVDAKKEELASPPEKVDVEGSISKAKKAVDSTIKVLYKNKKLYGDDFTSDD
jgi:hypothetical protein